jgi:hypothetical protein
MFELASLLNRATDMFKGSEFQDLFDSCDDGRHSRLGTDTSTLAGEPFDGIQARLNEADIGPSSLSETRLNEVWVPEAGTGGINNLGLSSLRDRLSN